LNHKEHKEPKEHKEERVGKAQEEEAQITA
jgi:hypothetical protein